MDGLEKDHAYFFFFENVTYPLAVKRYQEQIIGSDDHNPMLNSDEPLIVQLLVRCITDYKIPLEEVYDSLKTCFT